MIAEISAVGFQPLWIQHRFGIVLLLLDDAAHMPLDRCRFKTANRRHGMALGFVFRFHARLSIPNVSLHC